VPPMSSLALAPRLTYTVTVPPLAALLALIPPHRHLMDTAPPFLPLAGGLHRLRQRVARQQGLEAYRQPGLVAVTQRPLHLTAVHLDPDVDRCRGFRQGELFGSRTKNV
jgi:hypothetical protein